MRRRASEVIKSQMLLIVIGGHRSIITTQRRDTNTQSHSAHKLQSRFHRTVPKAHVTNPPPKSKLVAATQPKLTPTIPANSLPPPTLTATFFAPAADVDAASAAVATGAPLPSPLRYDVTTAPRRVPFPRGSSGGGAGSDTIADCVTTPELTGALELMGSCVGVAGPVALLRAGALTSAATTPLEAQASPSPARTSVMFEDWVLKLACAMPMARLSRSYRTYAACRKGAPRETGRAPEAGWMAKRQAGVPSEKVAGAVWLVGEVAGMTREEAGMEMTAPWVGEPRVRSRVVFAGMSAPECGVIGDLQ